MKCVDSKRSLNVTVVYATDRSKAVVPVLFLFCVALLFILRGAPLFSLVLLFVLVFLQSF